MKEKNKALEEIAGQAEYFASLYQVRCTGHSELSLIEKAERKVVLKLLAGH